MKPIPRVKEGMILLDGWKRKTVFSISVLAQRKSREAKEVL